MNSKSKFYGRNSVLSYIGIAILVVIALTFGGNIAPTAKAGTDNPKTGNEVDYSALAKLLTVTSVTEKCKTDATYKVIDFDIGALKKVPPRKWTYALSTPMKGSSDSAKFAYIMQTNCVDPLKTVTTANMLATLEVDGVKVLDLNPWLKPYTDVSKINDKAAAFVPTLDVADPTKAQLDEAVAKNQDYQVLANQVNTLLSRFKVSGVHPLRSVKNWRLAGGGLSVGGLPEVELSSHQESLPALVLNVTEKGACAPIKSIGFNTGDMRPEVFGTPSCKSTPKTHTTTGCKSNCGSTIPGCKSNCGTPKCVKPPKPSGGVYVYNPNNCTWHKPAQSFDDQQNNSPADQNPQDNTTSGVNTGGTPGAGDGTSSSTNGGTGTAPSGGDSSGGGGTTADNDPVDTGQGGTGNGGGVIAPQ